MIRSRTLGVMLLALVMLFVAAASLARMIQAIQKWQFLTELLPIWPGYLVINGLVWLIVGLWLFWGLWVRRGVGISLLIAVLIYSANLWLEKYWLKLTGGTSVPDNSWPFVLMVNVFVVAWTLWELYRPGTRLSSEERHEQQFEDRTIT